MAGKVLMRVFSLFLVFFIGFFSCIGAIIGAGYFAYSKISYDKLADWGFVTPNDGSLFDPNAKVSVSGLTLSALIEQIAELRALEDELDLNYMIDRYGVKLPEAMDEILVDELRELPLNRVFSENGVEVILENVSVGTVLKFVPDGVVSDPAKDSLKDKTLKQVVDGNLGVLLSGVKLGYLLDVEYRLDGSVYVPVFADPANPTLVELLAPIDLGSMMTVFSEGGDMLEVLHDSIADVALIQLVDALMASDSAMVQKMLEGKSVGEVIVWDEELGAYTLEFFAVFDGMLVGELLDLVPVYAENDATKIITWTDAAGDQVIGYMRGIASFDLSLLMNEDEPLDDTAFLEHVYFGDLLSYVPYFDADGNITYWTDVDGGEIDSTFKHIVMKPVNLLMGDDFSLATLMEGLYLGDLLGYTMISENGKTVWYNGEEPVEGMDEILANLDLEQLLDPESDYDFMSAFDGKLMGDILGYEKKIEDGETVWYKDNEPVLGIDGVVANVDLAALLDTESEYSVADAFDGVLLGEALGYEKRGEDWYDGEQKVDSMEGVISDIDMGKLLAHDEDYTISTAFQDAYIGDLLDYERGECISPEGTPVTDREYEWFNDIYDEDGNYVKTQPVSGVTKQFANYNLYKVMEGEQEVSVDTVKISEILSMHSEEYVLYLDGEPVLDGEGNPMTTMLWFDDEGVRSNGIVHAIAEEELGHLHDMVDHLYICDVIEYLKIDPDSDKWYQLGEEYEYVSGEVKEKRVDIHPVSGVMCALADMQVCDLSDNDAVSARIQTIKVGDAMGWYYDENTDTWYETFDAENSANNKPATGTLGALANSAIGTIDDDVKTTKIGVLLGYTNVDGFWYTEYDYNTESGKPVSGTLSAIVDFQVNELDSKIDTLEVGKFLGYRYDENGKWYQTVEVDGVEEEQEVKGMMASIAGFKIGTLSSEVETLQYGEMFGWEKHDGIWYETYVNKDSEDNVPASGLMLYFADLTINEMTDSEKVDAIVQSMYVGDAMGWYLNPTNNKWYESQEAVKPVEGIMQSIAAMKVSELGTEDGINGIKIGTIIGWEKHGDAWYEVYVGEGSSANKLGGGVMSSFADLSVKEMSDSEQITASVQTVKVGDAMGWYYKKDDGKWYLDPDYNTLATGTMATLANSPVGEIDKEVKNLTISDALGWRYDAETDTYYEKDALGNEKEVTGIMRALATTPMTGVNETIHNTKTGELLDYVEANAQKSNDEKTPYIDEESSEPLSWYHIVTIDNGDGTTSKKWEKCSKVQNYVADTKVSELDSALTTLSIGDVVDLEKYTDEERAHLDALFMDPNWENWSIPYFFDKAMDMLLLIPVTP